MTAEPVRVVVAGVPRSCQDARPDGGWLTPAHEAQIRAVSPRVELIHTTRRALEAGPAPAPGAEALLVESCGRGSYGEELTYPAFASLVTPRLRWLQSCSSGIGHILTLDLVPDDVPITNASGIHADALAESAMLAILAHAKRLTTRLDDQRARVWRELRCVELRGKTLCVIGAGAIGGALARRARAFGLRVLGVRRTARPAADFDAVFTQAELGSALAEADFVVVACPLTPQTEGMVGAAALAVVKRGAFLINLARGAILDDDAVLAALRDGRLGGAFLDAFAPEPLPAEHPYWSEPGVIVTPHDSHSSEFIGDNIVTLFCDNLRRHLAGEPLRNVVDRSQGY